MRTLLAAPPANTHLLHVRHWDKLRGSVVEIDLVTVAKYLVTINLQTNANDKRAQLRAVR